MNLDLGNSSINLDGSIATLTDFGGADTYTILPSINGDVTVTDNQPSIVIFPAGLEISSALFLSDGLQVTVNGFTITFLGCVADFTYILGGTPLDLAAGWKRTYTELAFAFGTTVPPAGKPPNAGLNTGTIGKDGKVIDTSPLPPPVFGWSEDGESYLSGSDADESYNIQANFVHDWPDAMKDAVARVVEEVSSIIVNDLPRQNRVDDISIDFLLVDLPGAWAGMGGYSTFRPDTKLPSRAGVSIDRKYAEGVVGTKLFEAVIMHEILHALGFGDKLWTKLGLMSEIDGDLRFTGKNATRYYQIDYAHKATADPLSHVGVPVEMQGPEATAGDHWRGSILGGELMTPRVGLQDRLSRVTLGALIDMGYTVSPELL